MDNKLLWKEHIDEVIKKIEKSLINAASSEMLQ